MALRIIAHHDDVAQRAEDHRPWPIRACRRDQRIKLEAKRAAGEGKAFDDDRVRPCAAICGQEGAPALFAQTVIDRTAGGVDQLETCIERARTGGS